MDEFDPRGLDLRHQTIETDDGYRLKRPSRAAINYDEQEEPQHGSDLDLPDGRRG